MSLPSLQISQTDARRFLLQATGLADPHANIAAALKYHGFIQIDPLNVCGRMQEHILRTRVEGYAHGGLHQHLHGLPDEDPTEAVVRAASRRTSFEHFHPSRTVLAAFPLEAWPYLRAGMERRTRTEGRWLGKLTAPESRLAKRILSEIETRGALSSVQIADSEQRSHQSNGWGNTRLVKIVLDKLFGHGRLLITRRQSGRRVYDLPERVLPAKTLARNLPDAEELARWTALLKLRQHRLIPLKRTELPHVEDKVVRIDVLDCPPLYALRSDRKQLDSRGELRAEPRLIAPLDPLILDRTLLERLWNFNYTWEVYTPAAKRKRGYYALPLLAGDRFIGHADLKLDRKMGKLRVMSRSCARGYKSAPAVAEIARFLSGRRIGS